MNTLTHLLSRVLKHPIIRSLRKYVWPSLALFIALGALQKLVNELPLGEAIRTLEYTFLQETLISHYAVHQALHPRDRLVPVVIDISSLRPDKSQPTNRTKLNELVDTLQQLQASAIGLDVDFSPDNNGSFIDSGDPRLFAKWLKYGNVRVGVYRREGQSPDQWLGRREFRTLAAGMMLPEDRQHAYHYSSRSASSQDYLLELPAALYYAMRHPDPGQPGSPTDRRLTRHSADKNLSFGEYVIDYSYLREIHPIIYRDSRDLVNAAPEIAGRVALVGDIYDPTDSQCAPYGGDPIAGVVVHACSLATLDHTLLAEIGEDKSLTFDLFILICVIIALALIRSGMSRVNTRLREDHTHITPYEIEIAAFTTASILLVVTGVTVTVIMRVFWPDFLWIAAALFLHPYLAEIVGVVRKVLIGALMPSIGGPSKHAA